MLLFPQCTLEPETPVTLRILLYLEIGSLQSSSSQNGVISVDLNSVCPISLYEEGLGDIDGDPHRGYSVANPESPYQKLDRGEGVSSQSLKGMLASWLTECNIIYFPFAL